jgi:hypothetical protein
MTEYDLQRELKDTISRYRMLAKLMAHDPSVLQGINEILADLERELADTGYPLAPRN